MTDPPDPPLPPPPPPSRPWDAGFEWLRPEPPPPPPPPPEPARRRFRWRFAVLAALLGAGAALGALVFLRDDGPSYPDEWDERVLDLVSFAERERGLLFEHPVTIEFLDEEQWKEEGTIDEELSEEDAQLLEHGEGMFRALGLAEGELDLLADSETLGTSGTVGHYSFEDETIAVRGSSLTMEVRKTLVHELTHVLQDQHFNIGERLKRLSDDEVESLEGSLRVLVEGDADRIEERWTESLSDAEREELASEETASIEDATEALEELPDSLVTFFASDYILGAGFVAVLEAADGESAIDDAFRSPPDPDEHVLDPLSYLADDDPEPVDPPTPKGEPIADLDGDFGAVSWYLLLAERIDPLAAMNAVDGWGSDAYVGFTDGDRTCVALRFVGEDEAAAATMLGAATSWVAAMPAEAGAAVVIEGDVVDLVTCDPGADAEVIDGGGRSGQAIALPATRATLAREVLSSGGTTEQARCYSRGLIANLSFELFLADQLTPEQTQQVQAVATDQIARCR